MIEWKPCIEVRIRVNLCLIRETSGIFESVRQSQCTPDAVRYVSMLMVAHLCTYSNCYINKTLVLFPPPILFFFCQSFSMSYLWTKIAFLCALLSLAIWTMYSLSGHSWSSPLDHEFQSILYM